MNNSINYVGYCRRQIFRKTGASIFFCHNNKSIKKTVEAELLRCHILPKQYRIRLNDIFIGFGDYKIESHVQDPDKKLLFTCLLFSYIMFQNLIRLNFKFNGVIKFEQEHFHVF